MDLTKTKNIQHSFPKHALRLSWVPRNQVTVALWNTAHLKCVFGALLILVPHFLFIYSYRGHCKVPILKVSRVFPLTSTVKPISYQRLSAMGEWLHLGCGASCKGIWGNKAVREDPNTMNTDHIPNTVLPCFFDPKNERICWYFVQYWKVLNT